MIHFENPAADIFWKEYFDASEIGDCEGQEPLIIDNRLGFLNADFGGFSTFVYSRSFYIICKPGIALQSLLIGF